MASCENRFAKGLRDGVPIALGYLSVSFTFGMMAAAGGLPTAFIVAISMTNLTSAGQFAGLSLMLSGGAYAEMALAQLVINLRYALMSVSLSQKLHKSVRLFDRFWIAFGNTDEIFAVASGQSASVGSRYMFGLIALPYIGWALGTFWARRRTVFCLKACVRRLALRSTDVLGDLYSADEKVRRSCSGGAHGGGA